MGYNYCIVGYWNHSPKAIATISLFTSITTSTNYFESPLFNSADRLVEDWINVPLLLLPYSDRQIVVEGLGDVVEP